ncbi:MAG: type II toxin-antitoxin system RelE family toxin [Verrucomicrobiota bacterium]
MPNSLDLAANVDKFLARLTDEKLYQRLSKAIDQLKDSTFPYGAVKLAGSQDTYRLRVGDYRILYRVYPNRIHVAFIAHRREVYR